MKITYHIHHRVNTLEMLSHTDLLNGAEIDIRYHNDELVLHHDPFGHQHAHLTTLKDFAKNYKNQGPLILNLKTEGIEIACIDIMNQLNISNWFFLDMSPPFLVKYAQLAEKGSIKGFSPDNLAVRFSEKEPLEYALAFSKQAKWLWVDCFTKLPLDKQNLELIRKHFKICIVSPELQNHPLDLILEFKKQLENESIDAVCSKRLDLW